ncbi:MAG: hypothetical protein M1827_003690 [Pycnora praestabilis]|nr:MAG: hypothetical protein M1827_003690 [Pycnora praestabilis]
MAEDSSLVDSLRYNFRAHYHVPHLYDISNIRSFERVSSLKAFILIPLLALMLFIRFIGSLLALLSVERFLKEIYSVGLFIDAIVVTIAQKIVEDLMGLHLQESGEYSDEPRHPPLHGAMDTKSEKGFRREENTKDGRTTQHELAGGEQTTPGERAGDEQTTHGEHAGDEDTSGSSASDIMSNEGFWVLEVDTGFTSPFGSPIVPAPPPPSVIITPLDPLDSESPPPYPLIDFRDTVPPSEKKESPSSRNHRRHRACTPTPVDKLMTKAQQRLDPRVRPFTPLEVPLSLLPSEGPKCIPSAARLSCENSETPIEAPVLTEEAELTSAHEPSSPIEASPQGEVLVKQRFTGEKYCQKLEQCNDHLNFQRE